MFDGVEIREGDASLPVSQATNIPRESPADDDPDDVKAPPRDCDPGDPEGKYPSDWPYHQTETHKFL